MASTYKSPGVYVEEIVKFPPSVASVETAIPAFIGYTEMAESNGESLLNVPTSIESFLEFEQYFGGPPPRNVIVRLNAAYQYVRTEMQGSATYLLYDSLRLFYNNGGGACYIVSVGDYTQTPVIGDDVTGMLGGLKALEKYDEPTLIVSPDSVSLDSDLYTFQQQAIAQCNKLQDRFLICDLLKNDENIAGRTFVDCIAGFRDNIGINYLKYGAAYTPWLRTSLAAGLRFRDVIFALDSDPAPTTATSLALLTTLTNSGALLQLIFDLSNAIKAVDELNTNLLPGAGTGFIDGDVADLEGEFKKLLKGYMVVYNDPAKVAYADFTPTLQAIFTKVIDVLKAIQVISDSLPTVVTGLLVPSATQSVEFKLKNDITVNNINDYKAVLSILAAHHAELGKKSGAPNLLIAGSRLTDVLTFAGYANLAAVPKDADVQLLYRTLAIKKAVLDQVKAIAVALPVATTAPAVATAVSAAIPLPGDVKSRIDTELATALATAGVVTPVDLLNAINTKLAAPGTIDSDKVVLSVLAKYVEEENLLNAPANAAAVVPAGFPAKIVTAINQALLDAKNAANISSGQPAANKASVVAALDYPVIFSKEYSLIASSVQASAGARAGNSYNTVLNSAVSYESTFDQSLLQNFGLYKTFVTKAGQDLMILPPGAAVAGVYASVDSNRGVWKAPANASLASVLGPYFMISSQDQESLNIDTNSGKSINAIRAFTGRGTLVWGTRTLAGNDNEWRYVPVRRFFNYAEESIKKATEPFVFEPNDINTWVRVKAMIENFLTLEWRRGSLAGAKPNDAFYVKIGLGETMTSLDVLEGRMIVEIGMAVVRPAEFIILRFSHKMQES